MRPVLYLSIDGVLSHLGFSQVFRVVEGLGRRGIPYSLVSMERARDLEDRERLEAVTRRAKHANIDWTWDVYREGGAVRGVVENQARLSLLAIRAATGARVRLVHARGYHAGLVAMGMQKTLARRWIFDARGYWIDERIEEGRWFTTPSRLRAARAVERSMFSSANAVVTLTQLQANDVLRGEFGPPRGPVEVIPTCADYDEFRPRAETESQRVPRDIAQRVRGRRVLGIVGSLNRSYLGRETALLAAAVLRRDPDAYVLVLSGQERDWREMLADAGVPVDRVLLARVDHDAVPEWMALMTWSLLLLTPEVRAKIGSMPTKLAEFLATGVRVCAHGCNREVGDRVRDAGGNVVLSGVSADELELAAELIASSPIGESNLVARQRSASHFSLVSGIDRYARLIRSLEEWPARTNDGSGAPNLTES